MAPVELSSNWKILQARLKAGEAQRQAESKSRPDRNASVTNLKRKSTDSQTYSQTYSANKRSRKVPDTTRQQYPKGYKSRMGNNASSTAAPAPQDAQPRPQPVSKSQHPAKGPAPSEPPTPLDTTIDDNSAPLTDPSATAGKYIALDCEMVGTHSITPLSVPASNQTPNAPAEYSILARVSIVNYAMQPIYDAYVLPPPGVTISDYRTRWSGITPWHLNPDNAVTKPKRFEVAQEEVAAMLKDRVLVGHSLKGDLEVLGLSHPRRDIRDTSRHPAFRALAATRPGGKGRTPGLKKLSEEVLGWKIQGDERKGHSSVEDARATMALFRKEKAEFEKEHRKVWGADVRGGKGAKVGKEVVVGNGRAVEVKQKAKVDNLDDSIGLLPADDEDDMEDEDEEVEDEESSEAAEEEGNGAQSSAGPAKKKKKKKKKHKSRTRRA